MTTGLDFYPFLSVGTMDLVVRTYQGGFRLNPQQSHHDFSQSITALGLSSSRGDIWEVVYNLPKTLQGTLVWGICTSYVVPLYLSSWKPGWVFYISLVFHGLYSGFGHD